VASSNTSSTTQVSTTTDVRSYGADTGPLLGLLVTTDPRLSTITLVGESRVVSVAESYLRQLDLRQRQVALSVKILDVSLDNVKTLDNSFAFRYGNNFIVNNAGQLQGAFGSLLPPRGDAFSNENTRQTFSSNSNSTGGASTFGNSNFSNNGTAGSNSLNNSNSSNSGSSGTTFKIDNTDTLSFQDAANVSSYLKQQELNVTSTFPGEASGTLLSVDRGLSLDQSTKISTALSSILGRSVTASTLNNFSNSNNSSNNSSNTTNNSNSSNSFNNNSNSFNNSNSYNGSNNRNPGLLYPRNNFYSFVQAMIESRSSKVLASPTLILSENSEELRTGEDTQALNISNLSSGGSGDSGGSGGSNSDNNASIGRTKANESYVTVGEQVITNYTVSTGTQGNGNSCQPSFGIAGLTFGARISKIDDNGFVTFSMSPAITAALRQQIIPGCGPIDILAVRRLDTGSARVRDGQTLVMTGVISDADREEVSKWPILGDLPIIGQFFRNSSNNRGKRELVILVTPHIINDTEGGNFGYGYQAGTAEGRRLVADPNGLVGPR
jgi:type IV pilus assembly protein PilQ